MTMVLGALNGEGIVFDLPLSMLDRYLQEGSMVPVFPEWHREPWDRKICLRKGENREDLLRFVRWLCREEGADSKKRWMSVYLRHKVPFPQEVL